MKICIDTRLYGPAKNKGLGRYVEQLVKNLPCTRTSSVQGIGIEFLVLLCKDNWDECVFREPTPRPGSGFSTGSLDSPGATGVTRGDSGGKFKKVLADYKWYSFAEQIFLPLKLWRLKCDLVHFPHFNVPLLYRGKFVVTIHDLIMYKFPDERATTRNKLVYKIKYWLHKIVVKSAVKRAERVIVVSEWTKKDVAREFNLDFQKIVVTHLGFEFGGNQKLRNSVASLPEIKSKDSPAACGVSASLRKLRDDEIEINVLEKYGVKRPYLLYAGNAYPHKNLERLIKVFNLVKKNYPDLQLVLVGKNDYFYDELKAYSLQLTVDVVFTDYIFNGELAELYKNAQAYIFPSLYEGFGLPGLEAMSCGLPVVSSNASCLPEIYGRAALYFNPNDIDDMSKKIIQILDSEELRRELTSKGFEQLKKYSWRGCIKKTLSVYAHLLMD